MLSGDVRSLDTPLVSTGGFRLLCRRDKKLVTQKEEPMKAILFLSGILISAYAQADSVGVMDCMNKDMAVGVSLEKYYGDQKISAQISEELKHGDTIYSNYTVQKQKQDNKQSPLVYKGKKFELTLDRAGAKSRHDVKGHVVATTEDGRQLELDVDCDIY